MASSNTDTDIYTCASCGKEGGDSLKACTACKMVKYCNRECQVAHRPLHKKACKKRAAELYDEALFKRSVLSAFYHYHLGMKYLSNHAVGRESVMVVFFL